MTDSDGVDTRAAMHRLRVALEALGNALASADLDDVVKAEGLLSRAVAGVSTQVSVGEDAAVPLRDEVGRVRAALRRSRRLGMAVSDLAAFALQIQGATGSYTRQGKTESHLSGGALDASA